MSWNKLSWNQSSFTSPNLADVRDERVGAFLSKVYGWMFVGLLVTAVIGFAVGSSAAIIGIILANRLVFWPLIIAQLGLVFYLSARLEKVAPVTAAALFVLYS